MRASSAPSSEAQVERVLWLTIACHAAAMLGMVIFLLPVLPGGGTGDDHQRIVGIAGHPWLFRLGWLPWQLTALSDLLLAVALLRARWIPRAPAVIGLVFTLAALVPDQGGQALWILRGVELAQEAVRTGVDETYLSFERPIFVAIAARAALFYTLASIAWSFCFARAGTWTPGLTRLSVPLWATFLIISVAPLLPAAIRPPASLVAAGNALGFVMLQLWFALVLEQVMRRTRPSSTFGRDAPWVYPRPARLNWLFEACANSRLLRRFCGLLPLLRFQSDITDVIYVNYLVPADLLEPYVPRGLELQRLGSGREYAIFTFLSYQHGHFGPAVAGPLRRWFSSPIQTNWRIYVRDPRADTTGVYFVTNAVTTHLHALGARLMAENMPMHLLEHAKISRHEPGGLELVLEPGNGSAPDARATFAPGPRDLPADWGDTFANYDALLSYLVPQDQSLSTDPLRHETVCADIVIGTAIADCVPLHGDVHSRTARAIVGNRRPLCFLLPRVAFRFDGERRHRWPPQNK